MSYPNRRHIVLAGLSLPSLAAPVAARPPFRLHGDPQPLLSLPMVDEAGVTRHLQDFAGRVVLLNIWASWCPPCRKEMPALERLNVLLGSSSFTVLPLCIDKGGIASGRQFYDEIGIVNLPLYWADSLRVQLAFAFLGLPTTLLVDRAGDEIARLQGPADWDGRSAVRQIRRAIKN